MSTLQPVQLSIASNPCDRTKPRKRQPPREWSAIEVAQWVANLAEAFEAYGEKFIKNGVSGKDLSEFDEEDLEETGIELKSHRKKILREWSALAGGNQ